MRTAVVDRRSDIIVPTVYNVELLELSPQHVVYVAEVSTMSIPYCTILMSCRPLFPTGTSIVKHIVYVAETTISYKSVAGQVMLCSLYNKSYRTF